MRTDARLETLIARIGGAVVALSAALLFCFRWHASVSVHVYVWYVYTHARVNAIFFARCTVKLFARCGSRSMLHGNVKSRWNSRTHAFGWNS